MAEYPPPGTPTQKLGPGFGFGTQRPSPFLCTTSRTPHVTCPTNSRTSMTPEAGSRPDPNYTSTTPVHSSTRVSSQNSRMSLIPGPGTPVSRPFVHGNHRSLTPGPPVAFPSLCSNQTSLAVRLGTPRPSPRFSNQTSRTPSRGTQSYITGYGLADPDLVRPLSGGMPGPSTPGMRVSSNETSISPCLGTGTPRLQTSNLRSTTTPGTPFSRPSTSKTPGTPFYRPVISTHGTPMTPLQQVCPSPARTPIPPTPMSSFALSVRGSSSSDEDMDTNENDQLVVKKKLIVRSMTGPEQDSSDQPSRSVEETEASIRRMDIDMDDNARTRATPSPHGSSDSSGLYSPLPCSPYAEPSPEPMEPYDNANDKDFVTGNSQGNLQERRTSPPRVQFRNSMGPGQRISPSSSAYSRPGIGPLVSTPLNDGTPANFQTWLAARGDRESVISYIRNIPPPSSAARAAQIQSNWSTPARTPTVATSAPGTETVIGTHGSIHEDVLRRRRQILEGIEDEEFEFNMAILSVVWAGGKLGASYYLVESSELFLFPDVTESAPDFTILKTLYKQVRPRFIVASSRQDERFLKLLKEIAGESVTSEDDQDEANRSIRLGYDGSQLFIQTGREFAPDSCRNRLQALRLPDEPKTHDSKEHLLFISSLIPFSSEIMVRAAGALLKFLDKSAIELLQLDLIDGAVPVLSVNICSMDDLVMVDETAWNSLQIFSVDFHPSSTKQGTWGGTKEGLSVFNLLNRCYSVQGTRALKLQLLRPTRDMKLLDRRFDVVEYCVDPIRTEFIRSAAGSLRAIKSIPQLLFKLSMLHTTVREWKDLYQTIYNCILLGELAASQPSNIELFQEIAAVCKSEVLRGTSQEMMRVIDFEESALKGQFVSKQGIDPELDKKRQEYSCLPEVMSMVAAEEMNSLPEFVQQCSVVYIPEVGYLLAISVWGEDLKLEDFQIEGLDYKFTDQDLVYYKSSRMNELDIILGDCQVAIMDLEACIMIYLTETILSRSSKLLKINALVSELDSLMALASVAREHNYIRPKIVPGHEKLEIIGGRHPLVEQICDFVPNSTIFDGDEKIVILTGPNASGKSIYLKQVGILVLMALSGSFIPATSATIPTVDMICTRIHAKESVSTGLSTFLIDVNQMSLALRSTSRSSLVIVDEFGKGTAEADGLSLLIATVDDFAHRGENSPTILVSTHYYSLMDHLECSPLLKPQTMEFMKDGNLIVYLFKLQTGSCKSSFAHLIAENTGIPESTVNRSLEIEELVRRQLGEESIEPIPTGNKPMEDLMISLADEFLKIDLDDIDPVGYMERICSLFDPFMPDSESPLVKTAEEPTEYCLLSQSQCGTHRNSDFSNPGTYEVSRAANTSVPETYFGASFTADLSGHGAYGDLRAVDNSSSGTYEVSHHTADDTSAPGTRGVSYSPHPSVPVNYAMSRTADTSVPLDFSMVRSADTPTPAAGAYGHSLNSATSDAGNFGISAVNNFVLGNYPASRSETPFEVEVDTRLGDDMQRILGDHSEPLF